MIKKNYTDITTPLMVEVRIVFVILHCKETDTEQIRNLYIKRAVKTMVVVSLMFAVNTRWDVILLLKSPHTKMDSCKTSLPLRDFNQTKLENPTLDSRVRRFDDSRRRIYLSQMKMFANISSY